MTLDMTGNELRIEPYSMKSLGNLIHLDLSNNSINFLANTLISLTKLKVLTMDNNKLTNIDFRRLPEELTDLSLRHNFITTIHYVPQSARNLRRIDLSGNMLDFISGSGSVNMLPPGLKQVDLSNNRIAFIQEGSLAHMEKLALLDLKGNQLTELKEGSVLGPKTRLRLFLEGNPFQCHCGLRWLLHAKEKTSPVVLDLPTLSCSMLLDENQRVNLTVADQLNQLICKYESNAQNIVVCEKLRLDLLAELPESVTELRIDSAHWKQWNIGKLKVCAVFSR
ncbi:leucine Rich repeat-containing domain protein [Ancylostoma caninum]|uniref:Leucine Rich repeat-containing domain protein n=1 Tax=Ancylostoma caninum TaxID=29170 RepID=A0A368GMM8_ANCCA|nr:leucine Rich repeat-containing domain protein [Ancylostoma caninum]